MFGSYEVAISILKNALIRSRKMGKTELELQGLKQAIDLLEEEWEHERKEFERLYAADIAQAELDAAGEDGIH